MKEVEGETTTKTTSEKGIKKRKREDDEVSERGTMKKGGRQFRE